MRTLPVAALAFVVAFTAAPLVLWVLRRGQVLDLPTDRSSHQQATPRCGGVAPAVAIVIAGLAAAALAGRDGTALVVVAVGLALIGLADDLHPVGVLPRLLGQVAVAAVALIWLAHGLGGSLLVTGLVAGAIAVWLVGYVNAFNFMDGINGLAVAQVIVAGGAWWIIGTYEHVAALAAAGLIAAAAAAAFAPFNVPRAQMFLGDVGSYFLGGWLAVAAIIGLRAGIAPEAVLAPLAVFLADASVTLLRRVRRHAAWSQPHREHAYQRLVQSGWSHGRTTLTVAVVMAAASACGAVSLAATPWVRVAGDLGIVVMTVGYLLLPARRSVVSRVQGVVPSRRPSETVSSPTAGVSP
jgi:UDP-GlcNAc:undecaprenyl-phosphate/decaprenyl-phosphate GlcNAc-1-phosphate transferase